jgi:hypothetical protein
MTKLVIGLVVAAAACGGGKDGGGGGGKASNMPDEIGSWMPKDASAAWQGSWTTRMNLGNKMSMSSPVAALDIKGDGAKAFDGKTEIPLGFELDSPCTAGFKQAITEGAMKGGTSTHTKQFLIKDGKLLAGEGAVGYRKGKTAIACMIGMDKLATLGADGKCKTWSNMLDRWSSKDTTCTWSNEGGKDILTVGTGNWSSKLIADGDLLMNEQFADEVKKEAVKKQASYDAAKQAVTDAAKK